MSAQLTGAGVALMLLAAAMACRAGEPAAAKSVFAKDNLVAWCIVPFDTKRRGPRERAEMLQRLGIRKLAYDWRGEHVPTFEDEILQLKAHGIEYFAFWAFHPAIVPLIRKHAIAPQFWLTVPSPKDGTQEEKVAAAAKGLLGHVEQTRQLGCKLGLYNHGGWGGEPANMVAVCQWLRANTKADHVGIVYNLHHGHGHIDDFPQALAAMKPYLLCLNLNGMTKGGPKILPIGDGAEDLAIFKAIAQSGYDGPLGIIGHRDDQDAEAVLAANLRGIKKLLELLGDQQALKTYARGT